ncbi:Uncharacterised protein [Streptococcus agalactiae]|uniref:DUF8208 domain-containing protein n=1 Tax=Streptococcus agalactiae serotype III (strain NEM316) TaxID=211110 RepID=Q8CM92_STRA3|nr:hypothetical protein [Streptococcus agalactiae]MCY7245364.1 hypothetical protein [Streptococcus agalactiae]OXT40160.1 hypothetical protein B1H67_03650 [Streptococcus agalactiae]CAD46042.1 Unknown [Streptococcus agalactiae NEM316]CAD46372.1 unknown [Streptococcus agalactiae NEM316]CAD46640.1 Unknown [Streptococcus agalactiae NEM316]
MTYDTYSDLVNALEKGFLDINGKTNGNITGENAEKMASFYRYWSNYLDSTPAFLSFLAYIPGGIAKALYAITVSLEHVFNNMFKLFGLFGYLGDTNTVIGKFFQGFQLVGTTLFILILVTSAIAGVFTKPVKYKGVITNFLLVTMVTAVLPLALTTISSVVAQDAMNIQTVSSEAPEGSRYYSSLAIQPMKNNVVDLKVLIDNDFSTELFPLDNFGYIKPPKEGSTPVNNITDSTDKRDTTDFATRIDFGATYGASNSDLLKDMEAQYKKKFGVDGIEGLFLHRLNSNQTGVETITKHRIAGELNSFEPVYMRYKVNWIGMFMQYIILIVLLISMSIKLVKSVFDIIIQAMISPIQGYSSLSHSKKYKELLRTMGGALAGIFFEVVIMRVTLEICRDLPTLSVSTVTKLSGGFFDGLSMWEQCLAACLVYIGVFLAAMQGVSMIERWLGVSTGQSETAQQLIGAMMAGQAFATGAGVVGNMALGLGGFGMNMAGKVPGAVASGSKVLGNSLATTGGGIRGAFNAVRDQGVVNAAKGGLSNMYSAGDLAGKEAIGKAKDFAGGIADSLGNKEQAGHDAVYRGLKDYSHPEEVKPVSPFDPDASAGFEPLSDARPAGGGITDPTLPSSEPSDGISEPLQSVTITDESGTNMVPLHEWVGDSEPPKGGYKMFETVPNSITNQPDVKQDLPTSYNHKVQSNFQKSMHQMSYVNQQMQQSAQRMQGQSHIRGAEIDESEE